MIMFRYSMFLNRFSILACALAMAMMVLSARDVVAELGSEEEAAYLKTITERAEKIVAPLGIEDNAKHERIRSLIADQYRALRDIHAARDAALKEVKLKGGDAAIVDAALKATRDEVDLKIQALHRKYVARLTAELSLQQVEQIKDGMTYGVVQGTYRHYLELLPNLTPEQKSEVLANLLEAREYAMDAGSADEKHQWFGKYKGRINNYLSSAGIDMKQAEKDWTAKRKAAAGEPR